jgi:hypothetical protein
MLNCYANVEGLFDEGEALIQDIRLPLGIDGDLYCHLATLPYVRWAAYDSEQQTV